MYNYDWTIKRKEFAKTRGSVFSCFACGGGSTMGYKLSGFDVIGCNEIDPRMADIYKINHNPKYCYVEPIQEFINRELPGELYNLDILDGSPPCSTFSMCGEREKNWGKKKKFREGQVEQILDTLFFDFINLAHKLKPKVVIAENVKGILAGNAKKYTWKIREEFKKAGYSINSKLLDSSKMGVPQKRSRVFFYAIRDDLEFNRNLAFEPINILDGFNEPEIPFGLIREENNIADVKIGEKTSKLWDLVEPGRDFSTVHEKGHCFNDSKLHPNLVCRSINTTHLPFDYKVKRKITTSELLKISTFPADFNFLDQQPQYVIGMSVPPVMMAHIADRIYEYFLKELK